MVRHINFGDNVVLKLNASVIFIIKTRNKKLLLEINELKNHVRALMFCLHK